MTNLLLPLNLQFFAETDGSETQQDAPQVEETPENAVESPTEAPKTAENEQKTFTQAELEEIIAKRLERERKKFADYEDVKTKASEYEQKLEEQRLAELTEKERAEELAKKYEAEKQELAAQLEAIRKEAEAEKVRNAFTKAATSAGIEYVDDAIALSDLNAITIDENGGINGLDEIITGLVENKPFLLAQKKAPQAIGNPAQAANSIADKTAEQLLKEAADKARKTGRPEDRVAYAKLKKQLGK